MEKFKGILNAVGNYGKLIKTYQNSTEFSEKVIYNIVCISTYVAFSAVVLFVIFGGFLFLVSGKYFMAALTVIVCTTLMALISSFGDEFM